MDLMNIGELASAVGIKTSAIRYYESIGLLPRPPRHSGWRKYESSAAERLRVIHAARRIGFSLKEIRILMEGFPRNSEPSARWQVVARRKLPELQAIIERTTALKFLIEAGLDCDCEEIALCFDSEGKACRPKSRKE
jgi:MerR family redox-sensitive transcriptional activator SoxR